MQPSARHYRNEQPDSVPVHVGGIAAPNAEDLGEMRDWARGEHPYQTSSRARAV